MLANFEEQSIIFVIKLQKDRKINLVKIYKLYLLTINCQKIYFETNKINQSRDKVTIVILNYTSYYNKKQKIIQK